MIDVLGGLAWLIRHGRSIVLKRYGVFDSWTPRTQSTSEPPTFAFFGELGFGILAYLPYLNHLSSTGVEVHTVSYPGIGPLFYFSNSHFELDLEPRDGWCSQRQALRIAPKLGQLGGPIFMPTSEQEKTVSVETPVGDSSWRYKSVHAIRRLESDFLPLQIPETTNSRIREAVGKLGNYWVVNQKDHNQWAPLHGAAHEAYPVLNTYSSEEINCLAKEAQHSDITLVINRSPVRATSFEAGLRIPEVELGGIQGVIEAVDFYRDFDSPNLQMEFQLHLLRNAGHVFASQGGNSYLAGLVARKMTVLLRGGWDYANLLNMAKDYECEIDAVYELANSKFLIERHGND